MEVILLSDVKNVGKKNDIITVSDGYGNNFLIKKGLAVKVSPSSMADLKKEQQEEKEHQAELKKIALENKGKIESITLEFTAKVGKGGAMIGEISTKEVAEVLKSKYNIIVDKRKIVEKVRVNAFGVSYIPIELYKDVVAKIKVHVSEEK